MGKDDTRPDGSLPVSRSAVEIGHDQGGSNDEANRGETGEKRLDPTVGVESMQ